jgi:hypothetical protein
MDLIYLNILFSLSNLSNLVGINWYVVSMLFIRFSTPGEFLQPN